jgi:predicted HNH restriction endonuclease
MACLTFHHHDPTTKEASIKNLLDMTDEESLRVEMDKCDLVCENCHRIIHHGTETAEPVYNFDATAGKVSSITITNGRITSITTA